MNARRWVEEYAEGSEQELPVWDDCDAAIVGIVSRCGSPDCVVYDYEKLVRVFMLQGSDEESARDWIDYNIAGSWIGEQTPYLLHRPPR